MKKIFFLSLLLAAFGLNASFQDGARTGLQIGDHAPELKLPGIDGKAVSLSSFKGKMVLIHFWASWYGPCRLENSTLVLAYNKYRDAKFDSGSGFEIFSVSLDIQKEKWIEAIKKDNLYWSTHVSDLKWDNSMADKIYKIKGTPTNILINGDGIIVAKDVVGRVENNGTPANISKLEAELAKHQRQ